MSHVGISTLTVSVMLWGIVRFSLYQKIGEELKKNWGTGASRCAHVFCFLQGCQGSRALQRTVVCAAWRCSFSAQLSLSPPPSHPGKMFGRPLAIAQCLAGHTLVTSWLSQGDHKVGAAPDACLVWGPPPRSGRQAIKRNIRDRKQWCICEQERCFTPRMCSKEPSWRVC